MAAQSSISCRELEEEEDMLTKDALHDLAFRHAPEVFGGHSSCLELMVLSKSVVAEIFKADMVDLRQRTVKDRLSPLMRPAA